MRKISALIAGLALAIPAAAQADFASSLVTSSNVTSFGSGSVIGSPDGGGLWLGSTSDPPAMLGSLTVQFANALFDGAGADLRVYDVANSANETFNVFLSSDNVTYTLIGGYSATNNLIDWNGLFAGPVSYVRLTNTSTSASADIDAIEGFFTQAGAVPEPSTWAMLILGFGMVGGTMRARRNVADRLAIG